MTETTPDYEGLNLIAEAITEWFGERCPDYAEGCYSCEAWKEYDRLSTLLESNAALEARVKELEARLAEADRVIEPFAEYLDDGFDLDCEGRPLPDSNTLGWVYLTLGHLRAARSYRDKGRE